MPDPSEARPGGVSCLLCERESADPADVVFRDEDWAAELVPGYEVPGWLILRVRRHAERITGLNDRELGGLGRRARDLVAATGHVLGAPTTYLLSFGEKFLHFHLLVIPRDDSVPPEQRSGAIMGLRQERLDLDGARRLIPLLREEYERLQGTVS